MQIHVHIEEDVEMRDGLRSWVEAEVKRTLGRFDGYVTRVEVHLIDENAGKKGAADFRCTMEARPAGHQPIAVRHRAPNPEAAVDGAAEKLEREIDSLRGTDS
jgi:ribosome-associated translation inhibitor RaiA